MGAYVTQNSYESNSAMLGLILMMQGIDTLVNAFIIFLYAELVAPHAQLVRPVHRSFMIPNE